MGERESEQTQRELKCEGVETEETKKGSKRESTEEVPTPIPC